MKRLYILFVFLFALGKSYAVSDSVLMYVTDFSSQKIQPTVLQTLFALPGVTPVSYCDGDNTFFMLIDRTQQPTNTPILDAIAGILGGTLQADIRNAAGLEYRIFLDTCEKKIIPLNRNSPTEPNSSGQ